MEIRPATRADLPATYSVFRAAIEELFGRHRFSPPRPPEDVFLRQHAHLLEHDPGCFWVAVDGGRLVGFTAALERGDTWFLSALFVRPDRQAGGVGKELFRRAWDGASSRVRRRITIVDAIQPVSTGMYSQAGLLPVTALMNLAGEPALEGAESLEASGAEPEALAAIDEVAYGFDRRVDHELWRRDGRATVWLRDGSPAGYAYRWPGGRLGPVAGLTPDGAAATLGAELHGASGRFVSLLVPASSRAVLETALRAGLRYTDPPGLVLSTDPRGPTALALHGYSLY